VGLQTTKSPAGSTPTDYLADRTVGLPQVVDDGTGSYLHDVTGNSVAIDDTPGTASFLSRHTLQPNGGSGSTARREQLATAILRRRTAASERSQFRPRLSFDFPPRLVLSP